MHGEFNDRDFVLGTKSFQDVMFKTPGYRQFLETIFTVYTVLFVGFSGDDPHLANIIDRIAAISGHNINTHYLFTDEANFNSIEHRRWDKDRRVRILPYSNIDGTHSAIPNFFKYLNARILNTCGMSQVSLFMLPARVKIFLSHSEFTDTTNMLIDMLQSVKDFSLLYDHHENLVSRITNVQERDLEHLALVGQALSESNFIVFLWDKNAAISSGMLAEINYALYWKKTRFLKLLILQVAEAPIPTFLHKIPTLNVSTNVAIDRQQITNKIYELSQTDSPYGNDDGVNSQQGFSYRFPNTDL